MDVVVLQCECGSHALELEEASQQDEANWSEEYRCGTCGSRGTLRVVNGRETHEGCIK